MVSRLQLHQDFLCRNDAGIRRQSQLSAPGKSTHRSSIIAIAPIATRKLQAHCLWRHGHEIDGEAIREGHAQKYKSEDAVDWPLLPGCLALLGLLLLRGQKVEHSSKRQDRKEVGQQE